MRRTITLALSVLVLGGCYHATVNTGVTPGTQQIERPWAKSFVYGLVPPDAVDAMAECGDAGVARVETQISFLNGLVSALTFSIFTPMDITVTCGRQSGEDLQQVSNSEELEAALAAGKAFLISMDDL